MDKIFRYFDDRYKENLKMVRESECGPIITISRQAGCDAIAIAKKLVSVLNKEAGINRWKWIDKEILLNAAHELGTSTQRVESYIKGKGLPNLSELIMAVSGHFVSDVKVKKAVKDVVLSICKDGYVVLVGRGGVSITTNVPKSLHARLIAPFYWRVENIIGKKKMNIEEAEEYVVDTDEKRYNLILNFLDKKPLNIDFMFDVTINRSSFSTDQIAVMLAQMYKERIDTVLRNPTKKRGDLMSAYG